MGYYNAHMRNIGLMAMAFDQADDPGHTLGKYLENATGAWLYTVDYLLRHDARGGLAPEGFEYGPHSLGYAAQFLLALHTAGLDNPTMRGAQVVLGGNPFWADLVPAYLHSLSPAPVPYTDGTYRYLGPVYEPAWYGDAQQYWAPDNMELFGPLGLYDDAIGSSRQLAAIRWIQTNMAPGGAAHLTERVRGASYPRDALFYFLLFDPHIAAPADPRPDLPLTFFALGVGHILARTSWRPDAAWFDYSLGWNSIDHQHADGNSFEFYRRGEWLTKQRTGYSSLTADSTIGSSQAQNTLTLQNDPPAHDAPDDYRHGVGQVGSQWPYGLASGDGQILAHSFGRGYVYALGDATALYNSSSEGATDITNASRSIVCLRPDYIVIYDRAVSRTAGRFKRFWLQLPTQATIRGNRATMTTPKGQHLFITNLLPGGARITSAPAQAARSEPAVGEPMHFVLRVEAPHGSQDVRFLHILQGADAGTTAARVSLVLSTGTPFAGALVDGTLILFPVRLGGAVMGSTYSVPTDTRTQLITGLTPNGGYDVTEHSLRGTMQVTIRTGTAYRADSGGVLTWGAPTRQGRVSLAQVPSAIPPAPRSATATDGTSHTPPAAAVATRTPSVTPVSTPASSGGHITYSMANGHVYRLAARTGAQPQDISLTLNRLNPSARDMFLNSAPDGTWLVLATGRGDPNCAVWACLAVVRGGGSSVDLVRVMGRVIHPSAFSAIASGGKLIVWPNSGDRPREDLWAIVRDGPAWRAPVRITGHSPYTYNDQPAIATDGSKVVFDCGDRPYAAEGTAICEVGSNGTGFRVVLTPAGSPPGFPHTGALHHPAYGGDGSIIFEASWGSEQIWQLPALGRRPIQVAPQFGNDNSPCVLPDGRIVSLWLDRPGNSGAHEIKVMTPDGRDYAMVLPDVDVADIGVGCGR